MNLFKKRAELEAEMRKVNEKIKKDYCLIDTFSFLSNWEEGPNEKVVRYLKKIGGVLSDSYVEHSGWHGHSEKWWIPKTFIDAEGDFELPEELETETE